MFSWNTFLDKLSNKIIGIVNVTDDSFTGDGILGNTEKINHVYDLAEKKDIQFLDVGCMSTKPNFSSLSTDEEMHRLSSFLEVKNKNFSYSIDSFNPNVINKALNNGFCVVNDVSGARESEVLKAVKDHGAGLIIVHRNVDSLFIHEKMDYKNIINDVKNDLRKQIKHVLANGIRKENIAIDLGLGFGKTMEQSALLLESVGQFVDDYPLIVGYSKKKFTKLLNISDDEILDHCNKAGVSLVRLHLVD